LLTFRKKTKATPDTLSHCSLLSHRATKLMDSTNGFAATKVATNHGRNINDGVLRDRPLIRIMGHSSFGVSAPAKAKSDDSQILDNVRIPVLSVEDATDATSRLLPEIQSRRAPNFVFALGASRMEPMRLLCVTLENPFFKSTREQESPPKQAHPSEIARLLRHFAHNAACWLAGCGELILLEPQALLSRLHKRALDKPPCLEGGSIV
jgi:hypothetical protein